VRDPALIRGYHAHVNFNPDQVESAVHIRQLVAGAFPLARLGAITSSQAFAQLKTKFFGHLSRVLQ